jgi:hypothetical protein
MIGIAYQKPEGEISMEMRDKLRAPLPEGAVTKHPTKTYLSSIKAIYVTERLNDVFGVGAWQLRTDSIERSDGGTVVVKGTFSIPKYGVYLESFGGNDNGGEANKNFDLGDAYKGATTDALTKIASYLEVGIDVFKGLHGKNVKEPAKTETKTDNSANTPTPQKPWLNEGTKDFDYVKKQLKEGVSMETIEQNFRISKATKAKLNEN